MPFAQPALIGGLQFVHPAGGGWSFCDDFTTCKGWVTTHSAKIDVCATCDNIHWTDVESDGSDDKLTKDLQDCDALGMCNNASNTQWLFRYNWNMTTYSPTLGHVKSFHSGLLSVVGMRYLTGGCSGDRLVTLHDYRGNTSTERVREVFGNCTTVGSVGATACWNVVGSTVYYQEETRCSATVHTTSIYSDACFMCQLATAQEATCISCAIMCLRYIGFGNRGDSQSNCGTITVRIDDVQFNDGTVCPP